MTFQELQNECINLRFKESQRESIKRWINMRYQFLWTQADWPWKRMGPAAISIVSGNANPVLPADFDRPLLMYDDRGDGVAWISPDEFDANYLFEELASTEGKPESFKWVNDVITVGPVPDSNYTYRIVYERGMTYMQNGTTPVTGSMVANTDEPIWSEAYHYMLVPGAIATGLKLENDPTFPQFENEFELGLMSMKDHYLPTAAVFGNLQYGRDTL